VFGVLKFLFDSRRAKALVEFFLLFTIASCWVENITFFSSSARTMYMYVSCRAMTTAFSRTTQLDWMKSDHLQREFPRMHSIETPWIHLLVLEQYVSWYICIFHFSSCVQILLRLNNFSLSLFHHDHQSRNKFFTPRDIIIMLKRYSKGNKNGKNDAGIMYKSRSLDKDVLEPRDKSRWRHLPD
jgi:hypothetical protein